jgi:hypothetical protein
VRNENRYLKERERRQKRGQEAICRAFFLSPTSQLISFGGNFRISEFTTTKNSLDEY